MADELAKRRLRKAEEKAPSEIAQLLYRYFGAATDTKFEWTEEKPKAVIIVTVDGRGCVAEFAGVLTRDEVLDARLALEDLISPGIYERNKAAKEAEQKRLTDYYATHPFKCGHPRCKSRFTTDAGRKIHERSCYYFKDDKRQAEREAKA